VWFLVVLLIGYVVAKLLSRLVEQLLERVGFDRWVERGSLKSALERSRLDASDILGVITFWSVFLIALQLAFGVFGPNPVSDLLHGLIVYLPNVFVAVVILVIAAALAKVVTDLLGATLGAATGGAWIARAAGFAVLLVGIFAALDQLKIAPAIVNGLYYAILAIIVGSAIVAVGGGGIQTMRGIGSTPAKAWSARPGRSRPSRFLAQRRGRWLAWAGMGRMPCPPLRARGRHRRFVKLRRASGRHDPDPKNVCHRSSLRIRRCLSVKGSRFRPLAHPGA
jgi:hypothetical protein